MRFFLFCPVSFVLSFLLLLIVIVSWFVNVIAGALLELWYLFFGSLRIQEYNSTALL